MIEPGALGPEASSPLVAAILWLQGALLGPAATSVAVICVAALGYRCLTGRIPARRAVTVLLGCFILFGAPGIASALRELTAYDAPPEFDGPLAEAAPSEPPRAAPPQAAPDPFDPYGGR